MDSEEKDLVTSLCRHGARERPAGSPGTSVEEGFRQRSGDLVKFFYFKKNCFEFCYSWRPEFTG